MADQIPDWAQDAPTAAPAVPAAKAPTGASPDWAGDTAVPAAGPVSKPFKDEDFPEYSRLVRARGTTTEQLSNWLEQRGYGRSTNAAQVLEFHRKNPKIAPVNTYTQNPAEPAQPAPDGMPQPGTATDWLPDFIQAPIERLGLSLGIIDPKTYYGLGNYGPNARAPNRETTISNPALPSWGQRFVRSMSETFDPAGGGINAYILRANKDIADDDAIRHYGSDHNWTGEQIDAAIKEAQRQRAAAYAETRAQRAIRDNDEVRRAEGLGVDENGKARSSWSGWTGRGSADLLGGIIGDANPTYVFAPEIKGAGALLERAAPAAGRLLERVLPGAASKAAVPVAERVAAAAAPTAGRAAGQGAVQATTNLGTQADEVSRGMKENIDPTEVILHGALGAGFQGGAEFLTKLAPQLSRWIVGKIKEPSALDKLVAEGFDPADLPAGVSSKDAMDALTQLRDIRDETIAAPDAARPTASQDDVVSRLTEALNKAGKVLPDQKRLYAEERAKRFARVAQAQAEGGGRQALDKSLAAMRGELPKADFESVASKFTPQEIDSLFDNISQSHISAGSKLSAQQGLERLLNGQLPQARQLEHLASVFPADFIKAALSNRKALSSDGLFGEIWNAPKSLQSTADLSGPLRQGLGLIHRGEFWKALGPMVKASVDPKTSARLEAGIKAHPNYDLATESGLSLTTSGKLGVKEDMFRSHLVEKIPVWGKVVQGSERAYVGFLNKLRFDTFNSMLDQAKRIGHDINDPAVARGISRYINVMTGRGGLGSFESSVGALNNVLYSPGLISSRLQILAAPVQSAAGKGFIAQLPKGMRLEAAKSYAGIIGANSLALTLAVAAGKNVNLDPRSSDFLKMKDGNTRLDFGGGLTQYITAGARALTRETTTTGENGTTRELKGRGDTPLDNDVRFVMNKLHPSLTLILDQQRGQSTVGEPFEWQKAIISRVTPMGFPDIAETLKEHGSNPGALYAFLGLLGAGLQNYQSKGDPLPKTPPLVGAEPTSDAKQQALNEQAIPDWAK